MAKITLNNLSSLTNENSAISLLNSNFDLIEEEFEDTLSRDGSSPNHMDADLDMNSNSIFNLPKAVALTEPVRLKEFLEGAGGFVTVPTEGIFRDRSHVQGTNVDAGFDVIFVGGYLTSGDGGHGWYKRVGSEPTHPGKIQSLDLAWWELILNPEGLDPKQFGARGDGATDDTTILNSCFDFLRASAVNGFYRVGINGGGSTYAHTGSLNLTAINAARGAILQNIKFLSKCTGKIALDFTGSRWVEINNVVVQGDQNSMPAVGMFFGRISDGAVPHPTAQGHNLENIQIFGWFSKACYMNLASEVNKIGAIRMSNQFHMKTACTALFAGHSDTIVNFCGMPPSDFQTIGLGSQSLGGTTIEFLNAQRVPAYNYTVLGISKTNPAVVTISSANAVEGAANFGLANGATVMIQNVVGTDPQWGQDVSNLVFTVANLNTAAGTFELVGTDLTAIAGTFVSAVLHNDTGPAVVLGQVCSYKELNGYQVAYSTQKYLYDVSTDTDFNWDVSITGRHEPVGPHLVRLKGNTATNFLRSLTVKSDNGNSQVSTFLVSDVSGGGSIVLPNLKVELSHQAASPSTPMFTNPNVVDIRGAYLAVPNTNFFQNANDFLNFVGQWVVAGSPQEVVFEGTQNFGKGLRLPAYTTAQLSAIGDPVNTKYKVAGVMVYNTTSNTIYTASGSLAGDVWDLADGSASITPV